MSTPFNVKMQKLFFFKYSQAYEGGSGWRDRTNPGCFGWGWMHGVLWVDKHNLLLSAGWCLWASLYPLSVLKDREPCANAATNHVSSRCGPTPLVGSSSFKSVVFVYAPWKNSNVCCLWKMWIARSLIHTVCEWKRVCVCGGAVQFALAGFQRLPPCSASQEKEMEKQRLLYQQSRLHNRGAAEMVLQMISACKGSALAVSQISAAAVNKRSPFLLQASRGPWFLPHSNWESPSSTEATVTCNRWGSHPNMGRVWRWATPKLLTVFQPLCVQKMLDYLKDKKDVGFFLSIQSLMQTCRSVPFTGAWLL